MEDTEDRALFEGHRERLRLRMEREGWETLKAHEKVELVLCQIVPRQDLADLSRLLVSRFGSVGGVFFASRNQLMLTPGMTSSLADWIVMTGKLMSAYRDSVGRGEIRLSCCQEVVAFLRMWPGCEGKARAWAIFADFGFNFITYVELGESPVWWEAANVRYMMSEAIANGARYVYIVLWKHTLSRWLRGEDAAHLNVIAAAMHAGELELVDCLLAGDGHFFSLNTHGHMEDIRAEFKVGRLYERYGQPAEDGE